MEQALADLVGPDLRVLFCGINPGTLSGELDLISPGRGTGSGSALRRWVHRIGALTCEQHLLPDLGVGITNLVGRVTAAASGFSSSELREGAVQLAAKVEVLRPRSLPCSGSRHTGQLFADPEQPSAPSPNRWENALLWFSQPERPAGLLSSPRNDRHVQSAFVATETA